MFPPHSGSEREVERFLVELVHTVSEKKYMRYGTVIGCLGAKLSFNILRLSVQSIKGSTATWKAFKVNITEAMISEATGNIR